MKFGGPRPRFEDEYMPEAYNGCACICHTQPGVLHCVPCCYPSRSPLEDKRAKQIDLTVENLVICKRLKELEDVEGNVKEMQELIERQSTILQKMQELDA